MLFHLGPGSLEIAQLWVWCNFLLYLCGFAVALYLNFNFNTVLVGVIYLLPLLPFGLHADNLVRFLLVSFQNTVFGLIELGIFVRTVQPGDAPFDREHLKQLAGHALPIAAALIGLSYVARAGTAPVTGWELTAILTLFLSGSVLRVLAVAQLGALGFKFDIVFRDQQKLVTSKLYSLVRHPSYTAMMIVISAYALTAHHWGASLLGLVLAWAGFQYRIVHEEKALQRQFGEAYGRYRRQTGMWLPRPGRREPLD